MNFELKNPEISKADLANFEAKSGITLPNDYSAFLLEHNGGRSRECVCVIPKFGFSIVNDFFGINTGNSCNLASNIERYIGRVPEGFLPIANDPGGNLFILCYQGETVGKVFFWDHENEPFDETTDWQNFRNIYYITSSFESFKNMLKPEGSL